jgi:hypothetical protein
MIRWHNHLNPEIKKERWTSTEDEAIIEAHRRLGNRWAIIAKFIPVIIFIIICREEQITQSRIIGTLL